jgi:lysozyme
MRVAYQGVNVVAQRKRTSGGKLNRIAKWLAGGALVLAAVLWYATSWRPSVTDYPVQGVDVSHQQGEIAWPTVMESGAQFAYIKATEGADLRDPQFAENWAAASKAGMRHGAYHYFTLCRLASDQATNFIANVPRDTDALPAAVDLDLAGNCSQRPARDVVVAEIASFIKEVEAHTGKPVILHLTREFEEIYRVSEAIDRQLWLRSMAVPPAFGARPWVMWQASAIRRVSGISGPVNWNVVRK